MDRVLLVTMQVDPAHIDEVIAAYQEHGRVAGETEPGLLRFDVLRDQDDPNRIYLYEAYADAAAHEAHGRGESHIKAKSFVDSLIEQGKCQRPQPLRASSLFTHARG